MKKESIYLNNAIGITVLVTVHALYYPRHKHNTYVLDCLCHFLAFHFRFRDDKKGNPTAAHTSGISAGHGRKMKAK